MASFEKNPTIALDAASLICILELSVKAVDEMQRDAVSKSAELANETEVHCYAARKLYVSAGTSLHCAATRFRRLQTTLSDAVEKLNQRWSNEPSLSEQIQAVLSDRPGMIMHLFETAQAIYHEAQQEHRLGVAELARLKRAEEEAARLSAVHADLESL